MVSIQFYLSLMLHAYTWNDFVIRFLEEELIELIMGPSASQPPALLLSDGERSPGDSPCHLLLFSGVVRIRMEEALFQNK